MIPRHVTDIVITPQRPRRGSQKKIPIAVAIGIYLYNNYDVCFTAYIILLQEPLPVREPPQRRELPQQ